MAHWRTLQDNDNRYVAAFELKGKDVSVVISAVKSESVDSERGKKRKVIVYFEKAEKPLLANVTNCKTISSLYGTDVEKWAGRAITLYPTTTSLKGEMVDCIRVRPVAPRMAAAE